MSVGIDTKIYHCNGDSIIRKDGDDWLGCDVHGVNCLYKPYPTKRFTFYCGVDSLHRSVRFDWIGCPVHGVNCYAGVEDRNKFMSKLEHEKNIQDARVEVEQVTQKLEKAEEAFKKFQEETFGQAEVALAQFEDDVAAFQEREDTIGYFTFAIERGGYVKTENPGAILSDIMEQIEKEWKALSVEDKKKYIMMETETALESPD
jgi:HMG (high mobility group) box